MGFEFNEENLTQGADFERVTGVQQAVLSHVIDIGETDDKFNPGKKKHQGIFVFQLAETYEKDGKKIPMQQCQFFTSSLNQKSNLRRYVEGMIGIGLDALAAKCKAEGKKFSLNLDKLVGRQVMLTIKKKPDSEYTFIESIAPKMKALPDIALVQGLEPPKWIQDYVTDTNTQGMSSDTATNVNLGDLMGA